MATPPDPGASSFAEVPMPVLFPAQTRGRLQQAGIDSVHSFSSAGFVDRKRMGFGALRVLTEECIAADTALPPQRRANMQVLTWVRCGVLAWSDGDASGEVPGGCVQLLDAGHGIEQVERNPSAEHPVDLVRLWLQPAVLNTAPRRLEGWFDGTARDGRWQMLAAGDADAGDTTDGALPLRLDAQVSVARVRPGEGLAVGVRPGRRVWLQVLYGNVKIGEQALEAGDALAWDREDDPHATIFASQRPAELLRVELPG
ncbi:hypothetical protein E5843_13045 [Luteimonas yindakuii]|nr:hypothetical protein E5843_13045 [Luteimonas yindakuii]